MKRILLFIIIYFGLVAGPTVHAQGVQGKLAEYIKEANPSMHLSILPISYGCGCGVKVINLDNNSFEFVYADAAYSAAHPDFDAYIPPTPSTPTIEDDYERRYAENYISHMTDVEQFQERLEQFAEWASNFWEGFGGGGNESGPVVEPIICADETQGGDGVQENSVPFNNVANASTVSCSNSFLLKNRRILHFTPAQQSLIAKYNFDGSTLVSFKGTNGYLYINATAAEVKFPQKKCPPDGENFFGPSYIAKIYSTYKFIAFTKVSEDASTIGATLDQNTNVWFGIPYGNPDYCMEVPTAATEAVETGKVVMGATKNGVLYCETLTAEDAILTTIVSRDEDFRVNALHLDHFINVPMWVERFFLNIYKLPSDCAIAYVNQRLDELHADPVYTTELNENKKKIMEFETVAYDLVFGILYCASDEEAASYRPASYQFGLGMLHEAIAIVDIKQIMIGVAQIAKGAVSMVSADVNNIIEAVKDIIVQQSTLGSVDYEQIAKKLIEANNSQLAGVFDKVKTISTYFKETYFTKCSSTPNYGDICPYRHGQVTMMALPIVLTAGDWAIVKATSLVNKYAIRTQRAIQLLDEAATAARQTAQETYVLVDDASTAATVEKTVIKETDGTVRATIKQEGEVGEEVLVVTEAASFVDDALVSGLTPEIPTASNSLSKAKFTNSAHKIDPNVDPFLNTAVEDVIVNGDITGDLTEAIQDYLFVDKMGLTPLDGKIGSNGFDGIFLKGTAANPEKIFITECKQQWGGGIGLAPANPNTGLYAQMSNSWIEDVAVRLRTAGKTVEADLVQNYPWLIEKVVVTVNKSTGDINLLKLGNF